MKKMNFVVAGLAIAWTQIACAAAVSSGSGRQVITIGSKCCKWQVLDRQNPRPELNPPEDIDTLPEREQRKFGKIFELVPEQVKVKSTQNYAQRMVFARSKQYGTISAKLRQRLARSGKQLAAEPAVTPDEVMRACDETITYGRMLEMGNMGDVQLSELADRYGFKNAAKVVERINDSKNLRRGLADGWPERDAECTAFAKLAATANPAQWKAFLERSARLQAIFAENAADPKRSKVRSRQKKQVYDDYDVIVRAEVPDDIASLPRRERVRLTKALEFLPARVRGCAGQDYAARRAFFDGREYPAVRKELEERLKRDAQRLEADPAVGAAEVLALCDEMVLFGRPLTVGDMREVSWRELATRYHFPRVSEFIRRAEEERNAKIGFKDAYPDKEPEFKDFDTLAKKANLTRWQDFRARIATYNQVYWQKPAVR